MAVNATAVWRVRPSGNNNNGGGYDSAISGAGTDYSQQNSAQLSLSDLACTTGTSTLTSVSGVFTAAMVGNAIQITSGTNFTAGVYFVTGYTNSNTVTLDRSPVGASSGSAGVGNLGGAWADFWTNTTTALNFIVPGNTLYILGSGIPNPAAYTYDYHFGANSYITPVSGNSTAGYITFAADPNTPNYSTGGMPCIQCGTSRALLLYNTSQFRVVKLWFVAAAGEASQAVIAGGAGTQMVSCVFDQFGYDAAFALANYVGCEVFSSAAKISTNSRYAIYDIGQGCLITGNNIHNVIGGGISLVNISIVCNNIVAKCGGIGINDGTSNATWGVTISNNTIDANAGGGIVVTSQTGLSVANIYNNIISNHTTAGTYGLSITGGTAAANSIVQRFVDYNTFYNNTVNYNAISAGAHDTALGSNPYVGQPTENYTLA